LKAFLENNKVDTSSAVAIRDKLIRYANSGITDSEKRKIFVK
jgi:hypothetical protein